MNTEERDFVSMHYSRHISDQHQITIKFRLSLRHVQIEVEERGQQHHHRDKESFLFRLGLFLSPPTSILDIRATNDEKTLSTNCVWSDYTTTRKKGESPQFSVLVIAELRVNEWLFFFDRFPIGNYFSSIPLLLITRGDAKERRGAAFFQTFDSFIRSLSKPSQYSIVRLTLIQKLPQCLKMTQKCRIYT